MKWHEKEKVDGGFAEKKKREYRGHWVKHDFF